MDGWEFYARGANSTEEAKKDEAKDARDENLHIYELVDAEWVSCPGFGCVSGGWR